MRAAFLMTSLRVLTWWCVILLAVLSLLPAQKMVRTGLPGRLEHFVAYAGSAAVAMAGCGASRGGMQIIGGFWVYAGVLEYLQHFSAGRHPSIADFAASAFGALCGGLAIALLWRRLPSSRSDPQPHLRQPIIQLVQHTPKKAAPVVCQP
jgi:VanZ family protein